MSDLVGFAVVGASLESFGQALVARLGPLNFWTGVLLGSALVLDRALSRRARASWRIMLYAPVALRVLFPLDWALRFGSAPRGETFLGPLTQIGAGASAAFSSTCSPSLFVLAAVIYVAVAAALAGRAIMARVRLGRALANAEPVDRAPPGVACPVVQHSDLGPMAVGLFAPRIVLPRRLLAAGEEHALACVLRHEGAHLRRGDVWLSAAMQVMAVVAWPVVPLWIGIARVRQLVELACDEAALEDADVTERRRYGHALLDIAERSLVVSSLGGGGAGELHFGSTLRARIEALASRRHWPIAVQALTLTVAPIALLVACAASTPAPTAPSTTSAAVAADDGYAYEFASDPAKPSTGVPASAGAPAASDGGRVPPEAIQNAVRAHLAAFEACYTAGLAKNPKLAGIVAVRVVFGVDGKTTDAVVDPSTNLPDTDVAACVAGVYRTIDFPTSPAVVTVLYPLEFTP